jgi:4-hydroxy-3-methylbut-2-enyl diphosphate reductase
MKILKADHMGMCFGVRDAISLAKREITKQPLTILGELVHNEAVLNDLRNSSIQIAQELSDVSTINVMITAHGASQRKMQAVRDAGFSLLEATCPLVQFAHRSLSKLVQNGYHPVIIGKRDHVEVKGMTEDLCEFDVVLSEEDISKLPSRKKFGVVSQTTQPVETVQKCVRLIRDRFPEAELRFVDTVCQPTKQRQNAATVLAKKSDVVVVIGGAHSNNTRQLVATCLHHCPRVYHVQAADDLKREWFHDSDVIGITAGTSTPDSVIEQVAFALQKFSQAVALPVLR